MAILGTNKSFADRLSATKAGCHLITEPFDLKKFSEVFPDIDVHKNSMGTLLYYPETLTNKADNGESESTE